MELIRYIESRRDKKGLYTRKELAIKYNVSIVMISNIINNKSWKNI